MTDSWWPEGYDLPAFRVKRQTYGLMEGGDWVRGTSVTTLPHTALRYPSFTEVDAEAAGKSILFCRPFDYHTVEIMWGWPIAHAETWQEVALVRSSYGHPSTPRDGQTVFRALRTEFDDGTTVAPAPMVYDQPLPSNRWYYYTLFFRTNPIDWVVGMSDACLLPQDYHHREYMWNSVPPYYQWVDDNYRVGNGHLRQFLSVFGFVMDNTRSFVEGVLDLHRIDLTAMPLLKGLGANYGLPYESGIGDIRYRGLIANVPNGMYHRGTALGLKQFIEAGTKYETVITGSPALMLYPDDSEFYRSTGNWGGLSPEGATATIAKESILKTIPWNDIYVARLNKAPAPNTGRGAMRVYTSKADATKEISFVCGDSWIREDGNPVLEPSSDTIPVLDIPEYREVLPLAGGISVDPGVPYGFSVWIAAPEANFTVQPFMIWIGPSGQPTEVLAVNLGNPFGTTTTGWKQYIAQGVCPVRTATTPDGRYLIPGVYIFNRLTGSLTNRSPAIDVCGAMVYSLGDAGAVSVVPPDRYLTMGDPAEQLGAPKAGFDGFIIGAPQRRT